MKPFLLVLLCLTGTVLAQNEATNSKLIHQFESDVLAVMSSKDIPYNSHDSQNRRINEIESMEIQAVTNKIIEANPARFKTTAGEAEILDKGGNLITDQKLAAAIRARRNFKTSFRFPPLLDYYQDLKKAKGLNPCQQLLAFRVANDSLCKAKAENEAERQRRIAI